MTKFEMAATAGTALVVCKEFETRQLIVKSLKPLAIRPEMCDEALTAICLLERQKFEAVIVDLLLGEEALLLMKQLRFSRANRTAVTITITAGGSVHKPGEMQVSTFVLRRPLSSASLNQTLRAAYGLVVRERRRYFRCPIAVPAIVAVRRTEELSCQTINVSEGGMAIHSPSTLALKLPVFVRFNLPERSSQFFAETKVCWQQEEGRILGLEFQSLAPPQKAELQEWLARRLDETLPESVAALFRNVNPTPP